MTAWNKTQYEYGKKQFELGQALGKLFVTDMPDRHQINQQQIDDIWQAVATDCWLVAKKKYKKILN